MDHEELKNRSRRVWGTGDYEPTSRQLRPASEALVGALDIAEGHRVLDVAAGHGNCAVAAARRGAHVCATDFSPAMIASGRKRTQAEGFEMEWREADAADLPFEDGSFDRVTSVFGAIFAPEQGTVASEAVRVTRQGGRIGFTAWTTNGFTPRLLEVAKSYGPPDPADGPDPFWWGRADEVEEAFRTRGCAVDIRRKVLSFRYSSWQECRASLEAHGMTVLARETMPRDRYEDMFEQFRALAEEHDHGEGDAVVVDSEYLEVLVTRS